MRYVHFAVTAAVLASAVAGCASESTYSRDYAYRSGGYYTPSGYYYANSAYPARAPGYYANGVYYPPSTAYPNPAPYGTSDNYYASRSDYYRNYQGIHGGPERTDGARY